MSNSPAEFINRELSWLEFNQRVLDEACDPSVPLLDRLKFLAITASNLDEFFMVRVGGLHMLHERGITGRDPSGMTVSEQLVTIGQRTRKMTTDQYGCYLDDLEGGLAAEGIRRIHPEQLSARQRKVIDRLFEDEIYPVLTPMAVTTEEPFPLLANQAMYVCLRLQPDSEDDGHSLFVLIPLGRSTSRFITLPSDGGYEYMLLEDAVNMLADRFVPGETVVERVPFRITRNADISVRDDRAADLLAEMEEVLDARKLSTCVRLEIADHASGETIGFLCGALPVAEQDVYAVPSPLDLSAFMRLTDLHGFDRLKYEPWAPMPSPRIDPAKSMFDVIAAGDVLLNHPFDSFEPVARLIEEASTDPDVLSIKQILYRTSRNSPIVEALRRAAERGKYVTAIVELKARFDEARNIEWAKTLEQDGVQVIYGVKGLKTHAKLCIIVRREPQGIRRYVHFGTGNYNEVTARLYTDVGYMSCDEDLAADATSFFNSITGYSQPQKLRKLEVAPIGMRERILELIEDETERKRQGQKARIRAKLNSLVDPKIIQALYRASQAGVKIKLNVRGICCLRPEVPRLSENICVVSIVDRFLEHSRIFYFHHGGDERVFISSADWMPRNLDRRVELLVPINDPDARDRLIGVLDTCLSDTVKGRRLLSDGSYRPPESRGKRKAMRSQEVLYREARRAARNADKSQRTLFEPHRAPAEGR